MDTTPDQAAVLLEGIWLFVKLFVLALAGSIGTVALVKRYWQ